MLLESVHQMMIYMFSWVNWDSASYQGSDPLHRFFGKQKINLNDNLDDDYDGSKRF